MINQKRSGYYYILENGTLISVKIRYVNFPLYTLDQYSPVIYDVYGNLTGLLFLAKMLFPTFLVFIFCCSLTIFL